MRLYQTPDGQIHGTQADARKVSKKFERVDVPTDKDGLIAYLNARRGPVRDLPLHTQEQTPQISGSVGVANIPDRHEEIGKHALQQKETRWRDELDQIKKEIAIGIQDEVHFRVAGSIDGIADIISRYGLNTKVVTERW